MSEMEKVEKDILLFLYGKKNATQADMWSAKLCTYSWAIKIVNDFESRGWVTFTVIGRKKLINLTGKGMKIAKKLVKLYEELQ